MLAETWSIPVFSRFLPRILTVSIAAAAAAAGDETGTGGEYFRPDHARIDTPRTRDGKDEVLVRKPVFIVVARFSVRRIDLEAVGSLFGSRFAFLPLLPIASTIVKIPGHLAGDGALEDMAIRNAVRGEILNFAPSETSAEFRGGTLCKCEQGCPYA
jgi:hypothetical protein